MKKILLSGLDTLEVGFDVANYNVSESEWHMLAEAKEMAKAVEFNTDGSRIDFRGKLFAVMPTGTRMHRYILKNNDVTLKVKPDPNGGAAFPEVHVRFSSAYLWRKGFKSAYRDFRSWLGGWAVVVGEKVSRADLSADILSGLPRLDRDMEEVVSRARGRGGFSISDHVYGRKRTGYVFGSGDCSCRIYDKVFEIKQKSNKTWFYDLWHQEGWQVDDPVTRIEFQLRRDFLRHVEVPSLETGEFIRVDTPDTLFDHMADLWSYLTKQWLSLRNKDDGDSNKSRWKVKPFWVVVQRAVDGLGKLTTINRVRQYRPKLKALRQQARGVLVTMGAVVNVGMGSNKTESLGFQYLLQDFADMVNDPTFLMDLRRRGAKLAAMT